MARGSCRGGKRTSTVGGKGTSRWQEDQEVARGPGGGKRIKSIVLGPGGG